MKQDCRWEHPYTPAPEYSKRVAYFSMEFGIDPALKNYSGGLGYLAGSHMRSAYDLKQNMIGIGMLWKLGYYEQIRDQDNKMRVLFRERCYSFLEETDLIFPVVINGHDVKVQAYYLPPEVFGTVPLYLLTTDREEHNDYLGQTVTHRLYDHDISARIAQSIVLGRGGAKVVEALGGADLYHMNEAHALPLAFKLYEDLGDVKEVRKRIVFTTHTPVSSGNEVRNLDQLDKMSFFGNVPLDVVCKITDTDSDQFSYTPAALALSRNANGVSQLHGTVAREMWSEVKVKPQICGITNAQHQGYWQDRALREALERNDDDAWRARKRQLKEELFTFVVDQTGKLFDPDILTVVWARRFAGYKRADLILRDLPTFYDLLSAEKPIQILWAGKPYPDDQTAIDLFDHFVELTRLCPGAVIVTGYEMNLSAAAKKGADIWLNTPRRPKEASGTSGMTAAMNGAVNLTINDGWIPEFARHGENAFVIPEADTNQSEDEQDEHDAEHLIRILTEECIPCYYEQPDEWLRIAKNSMRDVTPQFDSNRMADEYYQRLYS